MMVQLDGKEHGGTEKKTPTKGWKKKDLDLRIKEVRQLYLDELGQIEV